ncbi:PIKK family atypical protein kinase [Trichomonas vaginalis G3]|uniref:PIKK family atypical protein kinase n=1 Tax=Trichomonas vaginalis (strain ATCC PRA-98 / G3) TaxID=412133 RepID=A2DPS8_TRIV3|nr:ataxia telangiectasia mutated (ATM) -related family [Trichomonas vaginalis G3]EAY17524.1 PIKK family atypical protein kinase [Trichomonas vaginalis G3]KAI5520568.1 ataxia telangiectasia mutated (ATM) -related family [Trichomonas vaginalis G3]|eukprot:XP_001329659.1 PIKK family atypical protein kinase [Trichomonas vaginalis G3]
MNLPKLEFPDTFDKMMNGYEQYYSIFYHEMIRMSNVALNSYISQFLDLVMELAKSSDPKNAYRAAVGIASLHKFGYNDFQKLIIILERIIPQRDIDLVKFTSWCTGELVKHPGTEQAKYVGHLMNRIFGWLHAYGRRERYLAAAWMIYYLTLNAPSSVSSFLPQIQAATYILMTKQSFRIMEATVLALAEITSAVASYRRSEIDHHLNFIQELCLNFLEMPDSLKQAPSLRLLTKTAEIYPDYFIPNTQGIMQVLCENLTQCSSLVRMHAIELQTQLFIIDTTLIDLFGIDEYLQDMQLILLDFPTECAQCIVKLIRNLPNFIDENKDSVVKMTEDLINAELYDDLFVIYTELLKTSHPLDLSEENLRKLVNAEVTERYKDLFVFYTKINNKDEDLTSFLLNKKINQSLEEKENLIVLEMISELPSSIFPADTSLMTQISKYTTSKSSKVRIEVSRSLFNVLKSQTTISPQNIVLQELQRAISDQDLYVRAAIIKCVSDNCPMELASSNCLNLLRVFLNDDSTNVRINSIKALEKVNHLNPAKSMAFSRSFLINCIYILENIPSIRQRARTARILSHLINSCKDIAKMYLETIFKLFEKEILYNFENTPKYENFIEENSALSIKKGIIDSISLLAPLDRDLFDKNSGTIIPVLCEYLIRNENRNLTLSILNFLFVILSPLNSTKEIRTHCAEILTSCTNLLLRTKSRILKMAILKVVGVIGLLDVHIEGENTTKQVPDHVNVNLARQFYLPKRDDDIIPDSSLYLERGRQEVFFACSITSLLLKILDNDENNELFVETCEVMVFILEANFTRMTLLPAFDKFYKKLLSFINDSKNPEELKGYCEILIKLNMNNRNNIVPFIDETLNLLMTKFNQDDDLLMVKVVYSICFSTRDAFAPHCHGILCLLLNTLENRKTSSSEICKYIMDIFTFISPYAADQLFLIVSQICDAIIFEFTLESVRISGLNALKELANTTDMMYAIGIIIRSLSFALFDLEYELTRKAAIETLISLTKNYGKPFLFAAFPILQRLKGENKTDQIQELEDIITKVEVDGKFEEKVQNCSTPKKISKSDNFVINEDLVIIRAENPNFGDENNLLQWLINFIKVTVSQNPRASIRSCSNLTQKSEKFCLKIFNIAFLSMWTKLSQKAKHTIKTSFRSVIDTKDSYPIVGKHIISLLIYMDKVRNPIDIPTDVVINACEKYNYLAFALYLQENLLSNNSNLPKSEMKIHVSQLIKTYCSLNQKENATMIFKTTHVSLGNSIETKMRLGCYSECIEPLKKNIAKKDSFYSLINCLSSLSRWEDINSYMSYFVNHQDRQLKCQVAPYFAEASMHLQKWDDIKQIRDYTNEDSLKNILVNALFSLHEKNYEEVDGLIEKGLSLIASKPISFWSQYQQLQDEIVLNAQKLVELHELAEYIKETPENKEKFENVWIQRHLTMPRDFALWNDLIENRIIITQHHDENTVKLFLLPGLHENAYSSLFSSSQSQENVNISKICLSIQKWRNGEKSDAIEILSSLKNNINDKTNKSIKVVTELLLGTWISELNDSQLKLAYNHLSNAVKILKGEEIGITPQRSLHKKSFNFIPHSFTSAALHLTPQAIRELMSNVMGIEIMRKWALVCSELINLDPHMKDEYVKTAIECLKTCANTASTTSFPDVVQLLNLFFEYANKLDLFDQTKESIKSLDAKYLLMCSPQLLVQLSHSSNSVSCFVSDLVLDLLKEHYHSLIFSVITMRESSTEKRSKAASNIIDKFRSMKTEEMNEVELIRHTLLELTVTLHEKAEILLQDMKMYFELSKWEQMRQTMDELDHLYPMNPKNELEWSFNRDFSKLFKDLKSLKDVDKNNMSIYNSIKMWIDKCAQSVAYVWDKVRTIELSTISEKICQKTDFKLAVPGTYKVDHEITRIKFFFEQVMVYTSKQQPKSISVMGDDGKVYQYLLKGHEDLRLDERIMQFFSTVNSLIKTSFAKSTVIKTMVVMPLSKLNGLVQWVNGADTLKSIVEQYRNLIDPQNESAVRDDLEEYKMAGELGCYNYNNMLTIQKMAVLKKIFETTPDTDIANFLWLQSKDAEHWMRIRTTFAVSCAVNSAIGYVIGLGDRHPSNIMIDRNTGKMIHIDFGDCFEVAMKRKLYPEVVPFRLTRMLVKAMGIAGTGGTFRSTFVDYMTVLRENWRVLILVLAVFVHEPCVESSDVAASDTVAKITRIGSCIDGGVPSVAPNSDDADTIRLRVKSKLLGNDFGNVSMKVSDQADLLIASATSIYNLSKMFNGWCPFW